MRLNHLAAAIVLVFTGALCAASCVQGPERDGASADAPVMTAPDDGPVGEAQDEIKVVTCPEDDPVECMIRCGIAGIPCTPQINHPYHPERGVGKLVRCAELVKKFCTYRFDDGEECAVFRGAPWIPCTPPTR
jgi:hypothetical protein